MNKILKIILVLVVVVIGIYMTFVLTEKNKLKLEIAEQEIIAMERKSYEDRKKKELNVEEAADRILDLDIYEKINEKESINVLLLSNKKNTTITTELNMTKWLVDFTDTFQEKYHLKMNPNFIDIEELSVIRPWTMLEKSKIADKYDLILLDVTNNSESQLTIDEFNLYYEALIRGIIQVNDKVEIISMVNSNVILDDDYALALEDINNNYNVENLTFNAYDKELINSGLFQVIEENLVKVDKLPKLNELLTTEDISNGVTHVLKPTYELNIGREIWNEYDYFFSAESSHSIVEYVTEHRYIILTYYTFENGGNLKIYVNEKLIEEIDTYNKENVLKIYTIKNEPGVNTIRLVMECDYEAGKSLEFYDTIGAW